MKPIKSFRNMWVMIENYDSFSYILLDYLLQIHPSIHVVKNDAISLDDLIALQPERIIISPGPDTPQDAGICLDAIHHFHQKIPILGICLGHQAIGQYFGTQLVRAQRPIHGHVHALHHNDHPLFTDIPNPTPVMRYHSLILNSQLSDDLNCIGQTKAGEIMAIAHKKYPCIGLQFHPESVLTECGIVMLKNWANLYQ